MPKAHLISSHPPSSSNPLLSSSNQTLRRNQACHQCRRRKLKCDAKRPCSTCVRSHANAYAHPVPGVEVPAEPDCTFDDVPNTGPPVPEAPKSRYEKLETRINELEAMLIQKDDPTPDGTIASNSSEFTFIPGQNSVPSQSTLFRASSSTLSINPLSDSSAASGSAFITSLSSPPSAIDRPAETPSITYSQFTDMASPNWPAGLPHPNLLRHLVEVFFAFHPHAGHLLHGPSFLASLTLAPEHKEFPFAGVLHSICAVGSLYTAAVEPPPLPNLTETPPDEVFQMRYRAKYPRPDSFGEDQARLARRSSEESTTLGEKLLEALQCNVILMWYYHLNARWVDVFMGTARSLRSCVPMGLNVCSPFQSISKVIRAPSILTPARNALEDETRRNLFWLAYAHDRYQSCANGWALNLDDADVCQMLPVRKEHFEQGALIPPSQRQWSHAPEILTMNPSMQTDSFVLYVKAAMLLSRIKVFNLRFRSRHFAGDPDYLVPSGPNGVPSFSKSVDPRQSPAFIRMDALVDAFQDSIPKNLRDPVQDGVVDPHLYPTLLAPYMARILLHDPHAHVEKAGCVSAQKILTASRSIMDLLYALYATSYDITLVDTFCMFTWFMTGRVLVRFLQVAQKTKNEEQIMTLRTELEFLRVALCKVGERFPLAYRYSKMLDDVLSRSCGADVLQVAPFSSSGASWQGLQDQAMSSSSSENTPRGEGTLNGLVTSEFTQIQTQPPTMTQSQMQPEAFPLLDAMQDPLDLNTNPFQSSIEDFETQNFETLWRDTAMDHSLSMVGANSASMLDNLLGTFPTV